MSICWAQVKVRAFETKSHSKAKGVDLKITYPSDWTSEESDRPHTVQEFRSESSKFATATILVHDNGGYMNDEAIKKSFSKIAEARKPNIPNEKILNIQTTTIDGEHALMSESIAPRDIAGVKDVVHMLVFRVIANHQYLVTIMFRISGSNEKEAKSRMKAMKPLFTQMATSIVFPNKWSKNSFTDDTTEFVKGKRKTYNSKSHPKSKGANVTIYYPNSWVQMEGDRPNVVQVFKDPSQPGVFAMIITKLIPVKFSPEDTKEFFTVETLKTMAPPGAIVIDTKITKLDSQIAGQFEYSISQQQAGLEIHSITTSYVVILNSQIMVLINFATGAESKKVAIDKMQKMKPLFQMMANSIVLPDKWN